MTTTSFTAQQVPRILSLIETPNSAHEKLSGKEVWLLASGASCHMTNMISLLHDVENISPIRVELPNGSKTLAIKREIASVDSKLTLHNVVFVPGLSCNLISIAQLVEDNIC